jgi:hypothetical protein
MCRNITILRGLEPPVTPQEIEDAARQYVRKVGGLQTSNLLERDDVKEAIDRITNATKELLESLPPHRTPPPGPPQRRRAE